MYLENEGGAVDFTIRGKRLSLRPADIEATAARLSPTRFGSMLSLSGEKVSSEAGVRSGDRARRLGLHH